MAHRIVPALRIAALAVAAFCAGNAVAQNAASVPAVPAPKKAVVLVLDGPIVEVRDPMAFFGPGETTLRELTSTIDDAAADPNVGGLVVYFVRPSFGWAQAAELRDAITAFRKAGKPTLALGDGLELTDYLVASAADQVATTPVGGLGIYGMSLQMYFFKDMLAKLGVEAQAVHTGKFKTAMEPFTDNAMSEGSRIQMQALLGDLSDYAVESVAASRGMEREAAREALWGGPYTSAQALEKGLVTDVGQLDTFMGEWLDENGFEEDHEYGGKETAVPEMPNLFSLLGSFGKKAKEHDAQHDRTIVVIHAIGTIVDGYADVGPFGGEQVIASEDFLDLVEEVLDENDPAAIVLRVDSPGGSAIASDRIWDRLRVLSEEDGIPIVASMGEVAASGGYYISMAADHIVAEPTTITGSIGVVGGRVILGETYRKLGVAKESLTVGPHAGIVDESRAWNDKELAVLENLLVDTYDMFTSRAAASRGMTQDEIRAIAEGRVWTGEAALGIGLVDEMGGLGRAIEVARELSNEPGAEVVFYPREKTFLEFLEETMAGGLGVRASAPGASMANDPLWIAARAVVPERHMSALRTMIRLLDTRTPAVLAVQPMAFDIR